MDSLRTSKVCKSIDPNIDRNDTTQLFVTKNGHAFIIFLFSLSIADENEYTFQTEENNNDFLQECDQINDSGFSNDYQDVFSDEDNMLDNPPENKHIDKDCNIEKFNRLNEANKKFEEIQGTTERPSKLLHMQSSRSSLKSSITKEKNIIT